LAAARCPAARCPLPAARWPLAAGRCPLAAAVAYEPRPPPPPPPHPAQPGPGREDAYGGCHAPGADGEAARGGRGLGPSGLGSTAGRPPRETSRTTRHGLTASLAASACHVVRGSPASRKGHRFGPGRR
ncbi:hypothetical protein ACWFRL_04200, partial [Streptomyces diastaticus]